MRFKNNEQIADLPRTADDTARGTEELFATPIVNVDVLPYRRIADLTTIDINDLAWTPRLRRNSACPFCGLDEPLHNSDECGVRVLREMRGTQHQLEEKVRALEQKTETLEAHLKLVIHKLQKEFIHIF
jgi:hypothetical protein